jgi:CDP-6-deoxy-D-xylo-4-hexulose-3-dehydrase
MKKYEEFFHLPNSHPSSDPSWFGFALILKEGTPFTRNDITNYLEKNKIRTRLLFSGNVIRQPYFKNLKYRSDYNLENTDYIMDKLFWFGCYPGINNDMIEYMQQTIDEFMSDYL